MVPHQLAYLVYEPLRQNLFAAGLVLLGLSIVLGLALVFNLRRSLVLGVHFAAGMALLVMAVILFSSGSPFIALSLVLFGLFSGLTPLLEPPRVRAATPWGDLFLLAAGVIALANGVLLLLRPGALTTPVLEIDLRWERTFGLLFLLMGAALAGLQMWPDLRRRLGRWPIRLAPVLGLAYLAFFASAVVPERFGLAGVIYLFLGAALLCSPFWRRAASLMDDTSLRSRLGMALALATGVPLILTVTMISNLEEQLSRQNALSMAEGHAMGLADSVSAYIRLHRAGLSLLAGTEGLMDMPRSRQERLLAEFAAAYPDATAFSIYSVDGEVLATTNRLLAIPLRGSPVFQSLRQDRQAAIEELVSPIIRRPVLRFYHPVLDSQGRLIGAATATLLTERISNMLRDQSHLSGPVFYLVDSSGRLLAHPDMQQTARLSDLSDTPPVQAFLTGQSRTRSYYNPGGREGGWLVTYTRLPETGYGLVGEQPVSEALLSFHTGRDLALGVLLIFLLIVSFVGTLLARRLAVPLNALAAAADALAAGNYQAPVPSSEVREMNRLARSFELMRDRLLARTAEREQAQRALEEQRRLLQTTLDQAASGIAVIDTGGRIIFANRALLALAGLPPDTRLPLEPYIWGQAYDAEGRPVPPDEWVYRRALRGETVLDNEVRIEPPDGSSYNVLINASPMLDADGEVQGVVMVFNDITARKAAEEALRQANELLEERVAARTAELSLAASHDLQEPLRKINFFASRLKNQMAGSLDEQEGDFLNRMVSASQRMQDMIEALLTYSRVSTKAQPFVPVNLEQVARDVISDLEVSLTRSKGRVELGELPALEGDRTQLGQLLQNLIGNAIKFHRPGVPPVVRVWGEVETRGGRPWVLLRVADNGIGFEEKYLQRIFEPFERLHGRSEYEGSGMGLAICRKIVQRHGGEITAESRVGEGTTFLVALPQVHLDEQEAERTEERQK